MSSQVNVSTIFAGTLEPGAGFVVSVAFPSNKFYTHKKRARFLTVVPDPERIRLGGTHVDMEITRTWNTVCKRRRVS